MLTLMAIIATVIFAIIIAIDIISVIMAGAAWATICIALVLMFALLFIFL